MKANFLNRIELEKGDVIKVIFTVPVGNREVFALEKGNLYEIRLCESKLPNVALSPKELLIQAQNLISQATEGIPEYKVMGIGKASAGDINQKCANCELWQPNEDIGINGLCYRTNEFTPIYHWCSYWKEKK